MLHNKHTTDTYLNTYFLQHIVSRYFTKSYKRNLLTRLALSIETVNFECLPGLFPRCRCRNIWDLDLKTLEFRSQASTTHSAGVGFLFAQSQPQIHSFFFVISKGYIPLKK